MKKAKHLAEEYGEKAVNKVKSVRDEGKRTIALFITRVIYNSDLKHLCTSKYTLNVTVYVLMWRKSA